MIHQHTVPDLRDIQGNILTDYSAGFSTYLFYRIDLPEAARRWLKALVANITTEEQFSKEKPNSMLNVAITFQGLKALGLPPKSLSSFPIEFQEGMAKRASTLCDFDESAPAHWEDPLGTSQLHIMILVYGRKRKDCDDLAEWVQKQVPQVNDNLIGLTMLREMRGESLPDNKEHFGFRDGISQPWIEGTSPGHPVQPHGGKRTIKEDVPLNGRERTIKKDYVPLKLGEFILGYRDELDRIPEPLIPSTLSNNGTYLVFRKLRQDVAAFRKEMEKQATYVFGDAAAKDRVAALMVGRWPSGCPVALSPEKDDPTIADDKSRVNAFDYDNDSDGKGCPIGAHVRRTNPRDLPLKNNEELLVEPISTRHRMIRRSIPYGPILSGEGDDKQDRGLMFIALVADIARQFEFVQRHWINDGDAFRLDKSDRDPLLGNNRDIRDLPSSDPIHPKTGRKFTVPAATRLPWALNLPEFVRTSGGEYFFLPSLTALQGLARGGFSSYLKDFEQTESTITDPSRGRWLRKNSFSTA